MVELCQCGEPVAEGFPLCEDCFIEVADVKAWDDPKYLLLEDWAPLEDE